MDRDAVIARPRRARALVAFVLVSLLASLVAARVEAQARVSVLLPDCHPSHLDMVTLPELLHIELEDVEGDAVEVALSNALCDPTARTLEAVIRDRGRDREARESIEISDEPDPSSRARAIALAVAERARQVLGRRPPPEPVVAPSTTDASTIDPDTTGDADTTDEQTPEASTSETRAPGASTSDGAETEAPQARETLASPMASPEVAAELAAAREPPAPIDPLAPALTSPVVFRVAPVLPSWALGTRPMLRAHLDASFSLEGGVLALWSHAAPFDGNIDVLMVAAAGQAGYSLLRSDALELTLLAGLELGVLAAFGSPDAAPGRSSAHPWLTAGAAIELALPLTRDLSLTGDVGASGVIFGTRVQSTAGPQIELAYLTIDLAIGLLARLPH